jgi:hypothetical protein
LIKYTDRDGKEIEITMAAAYERIIIWIHAFIFRWSHKIWYEQQILKHIWIAMNICIHG